MFIPSKMILYAHDTLLDYIIAQAYGERLPFQCEYKYVLICKEGLAWKLFLLVQLSWINQDSVMCASQHFSLPPKEDFQIFWAPESVCMYISPVSTQLMAIIISLVFRCFQMFSDVFRCFQMAPFSETTSISFSH